MIAYTIPLQKIPNQKVSTTIDNIGYDIELNTRLGNLYISIIKDGVPVVYNRICLNNAFIAENFVFTDMNVNDDPDYTGLNDRFLLVWVDSSSQI